MLSEACRSGASALALVAALALLVVIAPDGRAQTTPCPATAAQEFPALLEESVNATAQKVQANASDRVIALLSACAGASDAARLRFSDAIASKLMKAETADAAALAHLLSRVPGGWRTSAAAETKSHLYMRVRAASTARDAGQRDVFDRALMSAEGLYFTAARRFEGRFDSRNFDEISAMFRTIVKDYPKSLYADDAQVLLGHLHMRYFLADLDGGAFKPANRRHLEQAIKEYDFLVGDFERFRKNPSAADLVFDHPAQQVFNPRMHAALALWLLGRAGDAKAVLAQIDELYRAALAADRQIVRGYSIYFYRLLWTDIPGTVAINDTVNVAQLVTAADKLVAKPAPRTAEELKAGLKPVEDEVRSLRNFYIQIEARESAAAAEDARKDLAGRWGKERNWPQALDPKQLVRIPPIGDSKSFTVALGPLRTKAEVEAVMREFRTHLPGAALFRLW